MNTKLSLVLIPFVFLLIFVEFLFFANPSEDGAQTLRFISGIFFFNTTHTIFSFLFPAFLKEYKPTFYGNTVRFVGLYLLSTAIFTLILIKLSSLSGSEWAFFNYAFLAIASFWHGQKQTESIFKLNRYDAHLSKFWTQQKYRTVAYFLLSSLLVVATRLPSMSPYRTWYFSFAVLTISADLLLHLRKCSQSDYSYLLRTPVYMFIGFTNVAKFGVHLIHGIESAVIYLRVFANSSKFHALRILFSCILFLYILVMFFTSHIYVSAKVLNLVFSPLSFTYLLSLGNGMILSHYFFEAFIYKFSNPIIKDNILPLFIGKRRAENAVNKT